ncbi:unnamed protein product [Allacma fusca]|uniref:Nucleoporin GLE1 n=1 Tax=Allacma fusca TaxID=39272 RepID=A0A8J2LAW3_9HEXA|nr:unnamed protein product [Allacma fusca]
MTTLSPRSQPNSNEVVLLANDIATLRILENSKLGQVRYETGWDKSPHSFFKLVSEVQQQSDLQKSLVLERAYQITVKERGANRALKENACESAADSSCSSSTVNEFFNNDYYESGSTTPSHTPIPESSPDTRQDRRVTFAGDATPKFPGAYKRNSCPEKYEPQVGHILKRGLGCREDEYDDKEMLHGFLRDARPYTAIQEALDAYEENFNEEWQVRSAKRQLQLEMGRVQTLQKTQEEVVERLRNSEIRQLRNNQRIIMSIEEGNKQLEAFTAQQKRDREQLKKVQEEKKLSDDNRRKEEQAAAARLAAKAEQERLEIERKLKEAEELKKKQSELAAAKLAEEEKKKAEAAQAAAAAAAAAASAPVKTQKRGLEVPPEFQGYIFPSDLQRYLKSQQLLADNKDKFAHISAKSTKEFYSAALKVVNTTLNSISNSPAHIRVKADQLVNLLQAKPVYLGESSGTNFVSSAQPQGDLFVYNLLAFRFVKKSESEISKGHTSVEPLAMLGVSVAKQFPQWAVLVRANFYKMCPFLVPFSFPRNNMSVEEYAIAMGHELKGSESAVRQALLDKMTGYCTLYTLMVKIFEIQKVTDIGDATQFFSMAEVWRILVASMKLKPQLDMTATIIQIILENLGSRLASLYGMQFRKLIDLFLTSYLPEIRKETPPGKTAALTRLELFLESKIKKGF